MKIPSIVIGCFLLSCNIVTGLKCYFCGTQLPSASSEGSMFPDPCWEIEAEKGHLVERRVETCPSDHLCVKMVTHSPDSESDSYPNVNSDNIIGEREDEEPPVKSTRIRRACVPREMNFGGSEPYAHRIGCGRLFSISTGNFYENQVACFCSTDYCNSQLRSTPIPTAILLSVLFTIFMTHFVH